MDLIENSKYNLNTFNELKKGKTVKNKTIKKTRKPIKNIFKRSKKPKLKNNSSKIKSKRSFYSLFSRTKKNKSPQKSEQKPQKQQRRIYKQPGNTRSKAVMEGVRNVGRIDFMGWASLF